MNICFIGDSLTLGTADLLGLGWPGRVAGRAMAQGADLTFYNLGVRAHNTGLIRDRWQDEAARRLPEGQDNGVVFSFGVADAAQGVGPEETVANAREILQDAKGKYKVLVVGPMPVAVPEVNERIAWLSNAIRGLCSELGVAYLSVFTELSRHHAYPAAVTASDGVHPTAEGYDAIAGIVSEWDAWKAWVK